MFEVLIFLIGYILGCVVENLVWKGKKVGTLLFHDPQSMIAELDYPVEYIYERKRVTFTVSRR